MYVFVPAACSSETEKAYVVSSVEHLQPFKDKMDGFLSQGRKLAANTHTYTHTDIHVHTGATIQFGFLRQQGSCLYHLSEMIPDERFTRDVSVRLHQS